MAPDERRASIVDAVIPLLLERGTEVTTRQIADAAGIAEGTVYRAFADKDELIDAAIAQVMDPAATLLLLEQVDATLPLEAKIEQVVAVLHARVSGVVQFMSALGPREHARHSPLHDHGVPGRGPFAEASGVVERLLEPDRARLRVPVADAVDYLRILVFGTSMPFLRASTPTDPRHLSDFILRGIAAEGE